ncbi:MAG: hypothetical protein J6C52_10110 [Clostridia bacterium]|nr:hypothetical protein [Clostridia bacterium]
MMKNRMLLLLLAAQLAALSACGGDAPSVETTLPEDTAAPETTSFYDTLNIPDFAGETFTILCRTNLLDEIYAESENGDVVNDAVYRRNTTVADQLNIDLKVVDVAGDWLNKDGFVNYVTAGIMAGDDAFQLIAGYMNYMPVTISQNLYLDITTLPHVNLDNAWWTKGFNDNVSINGKMYMAMGDLCSTVLRYAYCIYANVNIMEDFGYKTAELYQLVNDGKWTFDAMCGFAKNVCVDLDGNGTMEPAADRYGIGMHYMPIRALTNAFAIDFTGRDAEGLPEIAVWGDRFVTAFEKVNAGCNSEWWTTDSSYLRFMSDQLMFFADVLGTTSAMRDMTSNFAVVPMPKFDEKQENYRTEASDTTSVLLVPTTVQNTELAGLVLECMNYESWKHVTPAYFETAMQGKYARDEESQAMMNLIRDTLYFDFGYVYAGAIGGGFNRLMQNAMDSPNAASLWDSGKAAWETSLKNVIAFFREEE